MKKEFQEKLIKDLRIAFDKKALVNKHEKSVKDYTENNLEMYIKLGIMR